MKYSELSVHAVLAKMSYFFNVLPKALCYATRKAAVTYMREGEKLWGKGWFFAISAAVFVNVISSKYGARNGSDLKSS